MCILLKRWLEVFRTSCVYVPQFANNYSICRPAFDWLKCVFYQGGKKIGHISLGPETLTYYSMSLG